MALLDIVSTVLEVTGRPDKESYIRSTVDSITRMLGGLKDNPLSLVDDPKTVSNATLVHSIVVPTDLREVAYIRPLGVNAFLTKIDPRKAMINGLPVVNCYYRQGGNIIINLQQGHETDTLVFGYYAHPSTLIADTDTNWVVDNYQDVVIDLLCAKVFRITGDIKTAQSIEGGANIRLQQIINATDSV